MQIVYDGIVNAVAVDFWFEGNLVFWTDTVTHIINSANLNGTLRNEVVKFGLKTPCECAMLKKTILGISCIRCICQFEW